MSDRTAHVTWTGSLMDGAGTITHVGSGALGPLDITWGSRAEESDGRTSPVELIAAAHAACFSMALSADLAGHGHPIESVRTTARVHLRNVDGAPTIQRIELDTEGRIEGIDQDHFENHANAAKEGCVVSRALAGVPEIELTARLVSG
jgi:osmotically inducible protein OsmC